MARDTERTKIAVIIATHKIVPQLEEALGAFQALVNDPKDIIFVDNGSKEKMHELVKNKFPKISIICLSKNRYFCGGYNAGIQAAIAAGYEFVLIVNADTEVKNPAFISELLKAANRWPQAAFIGPLVFYRSQHVTQTTCLRFPNLLYHAAIWFPWRLGGKYVMKQNLRERPVEYLNGVCVLCRIEALRQIGLMDELFCGYFEDADWACRAREKGWMSIFTPVPSVIHHEDLSGYEMYSLKRFLEKRNAVYWFLNNGKRKSAWFYAKIAVVLAGLRFLRAKTAKEKQKHLYSIKRLTTAYRGLLRGEKLGEWFGPPLGPWNGRDIPDPKIR
jgi:N-acetylglucosaminyl-diphospho-decaprenol L-rhamnosyltransferase